MSRFGDKAEALFHHGYNCAQSVLLAFSDETHLEAETAARLASPFGAGMGKLRETCGAFTGSLMALGAIRGSAEPGDRDGRNHVYADVRALADRFREENGSLVCGELLGLRPPPDGVALPRKKPCAQLTRLAADLLAAELGLG